MCNCTFWNCASFPPDLNSANVPPTYHLITRHCEFPSQLKHLDHRFKLLVSQMKNVCYLVISRHRSVQLLPRPTPLLLTNPGHLLHPLHTSLVCSALTFLPDISSHLSACHGFPPIARNPSLFPLSHFTFPPPQPSTTVKSVHSPHVWR